MCFQIKCCLDWCDVNALAATSNHAMCIEWKCRSKPGLLSFNCLASVSKTNITWKCVWDQRIKLCILYLRLFNLSVSIELTDIIMCWCTITTSVIFTDTIYSVFLDLMMVILGKDFLRLIVVYFVWINYFHFWLLAKFCRFVILGVSEGKVFNTLLLRVQLVM